MSKSEKASFKHSLYCINPNKCTRIEPNYDKAMTLAYPKLCLEIIQYICDGRAKNAKILITHIIQFTLIIILFMTLVLEKLKSNVSSDSCVLILQSVKTPLSSSLKISCNFF